MKNDTVNIEKLIHEIEGMKRVTYEYFNMSEGLENPDVLAQVTSKAFGVQAAYDCVIKHLRELQGCDPE